MPMPDGEPAAPGVVGNERLTALAGAVLLALILVDVVTLPNLRELLTVHVLVGVLLAGPLAVKIGSTGYRFVRYYTGSPAYVHRGPPHLALRLLAPVLLATTLVVLGTGIGLVVTGPTPAGALRAVHAISSIAWLPMLAVHVLAHVRRVPGLIADDRRRAGADAARGRGLRSGLNVGTLLVGPRPGGRRRRARQARFAHHQSPAEFCRFDRGPGFAPPSLEQLEIDWAAAVADPGTDVLAASVPDGAGWRLIAAVRLGRDPDRQGEAELSRLHVDPAWWGRGVGARIESAAVAALVERGWPAASA